MGSDIFDLIVILILVFFSITGAHNGFIREVGGIIALVGGFMTANALHSIVSPYLNFISNPTVKMIVAYLLIFLLFMFLISLLLRILYKLQKQLSIVWLDKCAGLCFGLAKGLLICSLLVIVVQSVFFDTQTVRNSRTIHYLNSMSTQLRQWMPTDLMSKLKINP